MAFQSYTNKYQPPGFSMDKAMQNPLPEQSIAPKSRMGDAQKTNLSTTAIDLISSLAAGAIGAGVAAKDQRGTEKTETQLAQYDEEEFQRKLGSMKRDVNMQGQNFQNTMRKNITGGANRIRPASFSNMPIAPGLGTKRFGGA